MRESEAAPYVRLVSEDADLVEDPEPPRRSPARYAVVALYLIPAMMLGGGYLFSVAGKGTQITAESRVFKQEKNPDQAAEKREVAGSTTGATDGSTGEPFDPSNELPTTTDDGAEIAPYVDPNLDATGRNEAPENSVDVTLALGVGGSDNVPVALRNLGADEVVPVRIELTNTSSTPISVVSIASNSEASGTSTPLLLGVEACEGEWTLVRSTYACPGASTDLLGREVPSTEAQTFALPLGPGETSHLLVTLRVDPSGAAPGAGTQTDLTLQLTGG